MSGLYLCALICLPMQADKPLKQSSFVVLEISHGEAGNTFFTYRLRQGGSGSLQVDLLDPAGAPILSDTLMTDQDLLALPALVMPQLASLKKRQVDMLRNGPRDRGPSDSVLIKIKVDIDGDLFSAQISDRNGGIRKYFEERESLRKLALLMTADMPKAYDLDAYLLYDDLKSRDATLVVPQGRK
jgi:hypothetical protein